MSDPTFWKLAFPGFVVAALVIDRLTRPSAPQVLSIEEMQRLQSSREYIPIHRCIHSATSEEPGEPSIGPYLICQGCGASFCSESHWYEAREMNKAHNKRFDV